MKKALLLLSISLFGFNMNAQEEQPAAEPDYQVDAEHCKDHPLFNRMPNTYVTECKNNYDLVEIPLSQDVREAKEGTRTTLAYNYKTVGGGPSFFQIIS